MIKETDSLYRFFDDHYRLERSIRDSSALQIEISISEFGKWLGHPATLSDLSDAVLNRWIVAQERAGKLKPQTIKRRRNNILAVWRYAAIEHHLCAPPVRPRAVPLEEVTPDAWTLDELRAMIDAAEKAIGTYPNGVRIADFWSSFVRVGFDTGLRVSDIFSLPVDVLHLGRFSVTQQKTGRSIIKMLRPSTVESCRRMAHVARELLFAWHFRREAVWRHWKRYVLRPAGLPATERDGPQKLRRTSASHLASVLPDAAQRHLGHKTPGLAQKHYIDPRIAYPAPPLPPEIDNPPQK